MNLEIQPPPRFELTIEEQRSGAWIRLREHLAERLNKLRIQNDSAELTDVQTAKLRGQIQELKIMLLLDQPVPSIT